MTCPDCTIWVTCARCTQAKVNFIRMLERETRIEIRNTMEYQDALLSWKEKKKAKTLNKKLKELRKKKGWSLRSMAAELETSVKYLSEMESGRKPLSKRALRLLERFSSLGENA